MKIEFKPRTEVQTVDVALKDLKEGDVIVYRGTACSPVTGTHKLQGPPAGYFVKLSRDQASPIYEIMGDPECLVSVQRDVPVKRSVYKLNVGDFVLYDGAPCVVSQQKGFIRTPYTRQQIEVHPEILCLVTGEKYSAGQESTAGEFFEVLGVCYGD